MKVLPFLAALILLAELVGAVVFAVDGSWILAALLFVGAMATVIMLAALLGRAARRPPPSPGYVERERTLW